MTNLLEEVKEYFEDLFKRKKLDLYDFNSYEFCDLKLIKDVQKNYCKKSELWILFLLIN